MPNLDLADRVYANDGTQEAPCMWFAKCPNPANGLRDHPVLHQVPICKRCDDKVEGLSQ